MLRLITVNAMSDERLAFLARQKHGRRVSGSAKVRPSAEPFLSMPLAETRSCLTQLSHGGVAFSARFVGYATKTIRSGFPRPGRLCLASILSLARLGEFRNPRHFKRLAAGRGVCATLSAILLRRSRSFDESAFRRSGRTRIRIAEAWREGRGMELWQRDRKIQRWECGDESS
jgi:hypothetical protein